MFELVKPFEPSGDQPQAIRKLVDGFASGAKRQTLWGVTGSGKTFTMANIIQELQRPTLVLSHNKTLAAQLYDEFKAFFPHNAVSYFVSYYDYYQPEAYIPQRDIYIEKDSSINAEIDRLRLAATSSLISREDVIVVASVSSIYGLGSPEDYKNLTLALRVGQTIDLEALLRRLVDIQYERNDTEFERGQFRARGDTIDIRLSYEEYALRVELWGDEIESLAYVNPLSGQTIQKLDEAFVYPAKHFVLPEEKIQEAIGRINEEMVKQVEFLRDQGKLLESQRLMQRTRFDMEMLQETGFCSGIENYSAVFANRAPGVPPETLFDFFPKDFLLFVDESHVTLPQIRAMYAGDQARKKTLVNHGFRLPSALDNRPLKFEEWEERLDKVVFVSATPGDYEKSVCGDRIVEQAIRPTGLLDPEIEVLPAAVQIQTLYELIQDRVAKKERVLVTALTKRLAEDVASFFIKKNVRCRWLHSELDALERVALLRDLRNGNFDVLVGVNLLREGLDLPEVSLVAILDADKEGFLRSETSLIQTIGRCARNVNAKVVLFADKVTESMRRAIFETERRRKLQSEYNEAHHITPETVKRSIKEGVDAEIAAHEHANEAVGVSEDSEYITMEYLDELQREMLEAADALDFERAAVLRDRIEAMREQVGKKTTIFEFNKAEKKTRGRRGRRGRGPGGSSRGLVPKPER
ncbi:MAG: excinuclease ABC subunit UvrB [Thermoguttaceae bacterium]|nr:excinuclease ABC subunit UvrB [Thermoguttaceae bacterium]